MFFYPRATGGIGSRKDGLDRRKKADVYADCTNCNFAKLAKTILLGVPGIKPPFVGGLIFIILIEIGLFLLRPEFVSVVQVIKVHSADGFIVAVAQGDLFACTDNVAVIIKSQMMCCHIHTAINLAV